MARVPAADGTGEVANRLRDRRNGPLTHLDEVLLHSPPVADGWNTLLGAIRTRLTLPADLRELVILRVAALTGAEYEWRAHERLARKAGLSEPQLDALSRTGREPTADAEFSTVQRAAIDYTDAMTRDAVVTDALFDRLHELLGVRLTVELTATIAAYNLVSRFLIAMDIVETHSDAEDPD